MIAVAGPHMPVIDSEWIGDLQHAGHNQGALDLGGDAPKSLQVHAARVPEALNQPEYLGLEGVRADRLRGGCGAAWGSWLSEVRCLAAPGSHDRGKVRAGDGWPEIASRPHLRTPPRGCSELYGNRA
jgi:hypothetical protein